MQTATHISKHHRALVFDSGVGGLSVVGEIRKRLPLLSMDYVADDAFRPYGAKTVEALLDRLPALIVTLDKMLEPDCIIIACNTASTTALSAIRAAVKTAVIGVVPAIKPAAQFSKSGVIGVLGTPGTVRRKYVDSLIQDFAGGCEVVLQGSVKLVDYAERKLAGESIPKYLIELELRTLFSGAKGPSIDAVVLACTHFPLLRQELQSAIDRPIQWIDSGEAIARRVEAVLSKIDKKSRQFRPDTAFLIGPDAEQARLAAFESFGFDKTIGLSP